MTIAHSETGQMAVCYQNLTQGALSSHSVLSMLVGALFKKFCLFLNVPHMSVLTNRHTQQALKLKSSLLCSGYIIFLLLQLSVVLYLCCISEGSDVYIPLCYFCLCLSLHDIHKICVLHCFYCALSFTVVM